MTNESKNPLFDSQKEKSGSQTYDKYAYQYHWALYKILSDHNKVNEYAVFVELHEDVVISNSLNSSKASFEFNQVKTNQSAFNTYQLVIKKKNGKSILGKLISSGHSKPFTKQISSLNLVSLNKFNLELKTPGVSLNNIRIEDLSLKQLKDLEDEIKKELNISALPSNVQFIVPELSEKNYQNDVIATIATLIDNLFPGSYCNSLEIYRLLIDEINRKGKVTYDFSKWDELIQKKALTSITVTTIINQFTNIKDQGKIESELLMICEEIGLKSIPSKKLKQSFGRYQSLRLSNKSTMQMDTTIFFVNEIQKNIDNGIVDLKLLIENVNTSTPTKIKKQFTSSIELDGAIICEYIMMN